MGHKNNSLDRGLRTWPILLILIPKILQVPSECDILQTISVRPSLIYHPTVLGSNTSLKTPGYRCFSSVNICLNEIAFYTELQKE